MLLQTSRQAPVVMPVEVIVEDDLRVDQREFEFAAWHAALCAGLSTVSEHNVRARVHGEVCVSLIGTDQSRNLNLTYRGKDKATNVLSFPAEVDLPELNLLGELAICYPLVESEARAQGKSTIHHLAHLYVHGTLHLLGFDHETAADAEVMEGLEREVLATINIADPYVLRED